MDSKLKCVFALPPGQELNNVEEKFEPGYDNARSQVAATPAQSEVKVRFRLESHGPSFLFILFFLQHAALQYEGYDHFLKLAFVISSKTSKLLYEILK